MSCPHSRLDGPCSQCMLATPTVVTRVGTELHVAGVVVRASQLGPDPAMQRHRRRGARHSANARTHKAKAKAGC